MECVKNRNVSKTHLPLLTKRVVQRTLMRGYLRIPFRIIGVSFINVKGATAKFSDSIYGQECIRMTFGQKLKQLRQIKQMTQEQVSTAAGISRKTYYSYEQGDTHPRKRETYDNLAKVLGCDVVYLLSNNEEFIVRAADQYGNRGKRQAEELVAELSGMFAGGELSEHDKDAVMAALQRAYFDCKLDNKKYTSKKHQDK